jgi:hypothetical protein
MDKKGQASLLSQIEKEIEEMMDHSMDPVLLLGGKCNVMKNMKKKKPF